MRIFYQRDRKNFNPILIKTEELKRKKMQKLVKVNSKGYSVYHGNVHKREYARDLQHGRFHDKPS